MTQKFETQKGKSICFSKLHEILIFYHIGKETKTPSLLSVEHNESTQDYPYG
jgi:hypothetical protein